MNLIKMFTDAEYVAILNDIARQVEVIKNDAEQVAKNDHAVYTWPDLLVGHPDNFNSYPPLYRTVYLRYETRFKKFCVMSDETVPAGGYWSDESDIRSCVCSEFYLSAEQAFAFGCELHLKFEKELAEEFEKELTEEQEGGDLSISILRLCNGSGESSHEQI